MAFLHKKIIFPDFQKVEYYFVCFDNDISSQNSKLMQRHALSYFSHLLKTKTWKITFQNTFIKTKTLELLKVHVHVSGNQ